MDQRPRLFGAFLAIGILAASQSGNLVRLGDASPFAIATWRLALASLMLAPFAGRRLAALAQLPGRDLGLLAVAGVALAGHLVAWIAAVQHTTVANAAVFFAVNPVMTAGAARLLFGERLGPRLLLAIALGLAGVVVIGAHALDLSSDSLVGDGLALLCAALFTVYFLLGKRLRARLEARVYVTAVYGAAALAGFVALVAVGAPLVAYDAQNWLCFGLMALVPTVIGHSALNFALRYMDVSRVSALTLIEPALAGAVAWVAWGEPLTGSTLAGYALIAGSGLVLAFDGWQQTRLAAAARLPVAGPAPLPALAREAARVPHGPGRSVRE